MPTSLIDGRSVVLFTHAFRCSQVMRFVSSSLPSKKAFQKGTISVAMSTSLNQTQLTVLTWVVTGAGLVLTAGRYVMRSQTLKHFRIDDYLHGSAQLVCVAYIISYTIMFPLNYSVEFWVAGIGPQPTQGDLHQYFHLEIAVSCLFWIIIYLVKFSFLFFYRDLFRISRRFMRAWWCIFAFTILTFLVCFISVFWACEAPSGLFNIRRCLSDKALATNAKVVSMWCGLNVASDLSIMVLPLCMLKGLKIPNSQKIGLAFLFMIGLLDVAFDITRTIYTVDGGAVALDTVWDILEPNVAIIVCALPAYKALLGRQKRLSLFVSTSKRDSTRRFAGSSTSRSETVYHQSVTQFQLSKADSSHSSLRNTEEPAQMSISANSVV